MIEHIWSVLCARSATDRETNNLSLFEILEQVNILGPLPDPGANAAFPMQYEVVSLWARANSAEAEESRGRIKLIAPSGAQVFAQEFPVNLSENLRMRTQLRSMGFPLLGPGRYRFEVEIQRANENWETVARIPLQVESIAQAPGETTAPGS
jgi:hypothetical protein